MVTKHAKTLVSEATAQVKTLSADEAVKLIGKPDVVFVDLRESEELQKTGKIDGAIHVPRGFLEFQADPESPSHKAALGSGKMLALYCGSGSRSALGAKSLQDMGIANVAHVAGGISALKEAGGAVEE